MTPLARVRRRVALDRRTLLWGVLLVNVELLLVALYVALESVVITAPRYLLYPFVWINVGLWAVAATRPAPASARQRRLGIAVGVAYFLLLGYVGGVFSPGHAFHGHAHAFGLRVAWPLPPGWGPTVIYAGEWIGLTLTPYKVIGYAALAYLVYATVLEAAGSAITGVVGLLSCVSCTWPVLGTVLTGLLGGSSAVVAFAADQPYGASTLVFVSAVALLSWRPTLG